MISAEGRVAEAGDWIARPAGSDIVAEGEHGDAFYVVAAGRLTVTEKGVFKRDLGPCGTCNEVKQVIQAVALRPAGRALPQFVSVLKPPAPATDEC